jgi:hypothetical protein
MSRQVRVKPRGEEQHANKDHQHAAQRRARLALDGKAHHPHHPGAHQIERPQAHQPLDHARALWSQEEENPCSHQQHAEQQPPPLFPSCFPGCGRQFLVTSAP